MKHCHTCGFASNHMTHCPNCANNPVLEPARPDGAVFSPAHGSANEPLTSRESAQLEATLVLLRRGELPLAVRVLNPERDTELARDLQAYIAAHSPSERADVPENDL